MNNDMQKIIQGGPKKAATKW